MTPGEKALVHQIHPAKLATDVTASVVSTVLLWNHDLVGGLVVLFLPPIIATALVMRFVPLEPYRDSPAGRYITCYMTTAAQAARGIGALAMSIGAWSRSRALILLGLAIIAVAWGWGLARKVG
jgi:hypothetical protein